MGPPAYIGGVVRRLLQAEFLQALGTGNHGRAVQAQIDMLDVAELVRHDPFLACQRERVEVAGKALDGLEIALASADLADGQFRAVDRRLDEMEERFRLASAIHTERAVQFTAMNDIQVNLRAISDKHYCRFGVCVDQPRHVWYGSFVYLPQMMREQAVMLRSMSRLAACVDQPGPAGQRKLDQIESDLCVEVDDQPVNAELWVSSSGEVYYAYAREMGLAHRQRLIAARLGLRVSRYRAEQGRLPDSLDQILDRQLDAVPAGLFSGKPLIYEAGADRFAIYDVDPATDEPAGRFEVSWARAPER